ncbi:MAG: hypothetical protein IJ222_04675 [Bacteroidales bacterium]|nr:hypothetical protein [Bacteroidales bacterium]
MLQALFKQKLGRAIQEGIFHGIEDTLTSSVVGLLQYLPDALFWKVLRGSCGASLASLPEDVGPIQGVHFWERMDATGTYNSQSVEPDVWIETDLYNIIIEAKRSDSSSDNAQSTYQWFNEIVALNNSTKGETDKELVFLAIGGNDTLRDLIFDVNGKEYIIHTASWFDLLGAVSKNRETLTNNPAETNLVRILEDVIKAMQYHGIFYTIWLNSITVEPIDMDANHYLRESWSFDNTGFLNNMHFTSIKLESLSDIWTTR